jgi:Flp pilus assembly protein TadD
MRESTCSTDRKYEWIVYAVAMLLVGGLAGYVLAVQGSRAAAPATAAPAPPAQSAAAPQPAVVDESQLAAYRSILARDPRNLQAAVAAGNMLYDAHRYEEAIPLYRQAFAIVPSDINISTDLGTALWYAGRADEALAQYARSLALNPTHPQTLFNIGIVRADGKRDYAGAVAAWERLLASNPSYDNATRVRQLIADARTKARG